MELGIVVTIAFLQYAVRLVVLAVASGSRPDKDRKRCVMRQA